MRLFSTFAARMTVLRKEGYYMSDVQARRVMKKLGFVLELNDFQVTCTIAHITGNVRRDFTSYLDDAGLTASEAEVVRNLMCWYSQEYSNQGENPCFLALNLNRGYSLVISDGRPSKRVAAVLGHEGGAF